MPARLPVDIPKAVLAAILIKVGTDIIDWDYLKRFKNSAESRHCYHAHRFGDYCFQLIYYLRLGIGMVMASFLFMKRITDMQIASIKTVINPDEIAHEVALSEQEAEIMQLADGKNYVISYERANELFRLQKPLFGRHASTVGYSIMLLDLSDVPSIDFTTSRALEDIITDTISAGRQIFLVGACKNVCTTLEQQGIVDHFETGNMYKNRLDALFTCKKVYYR